MSIAYTTQLAYSILVALSTLYIYSLVSSCGVGEGFEGLSLRQLQNSHAYNNGQRLYSLADALAWLSLFLYAFIYILS